MRQVIISIVFLLPFCAISVLAQQANPKLLEQLLNFPAPRPGTVEKEKAKRPETFFDPNNTPSDDAPIDVLLDYWQFQSSNFDQFRYNLKPSKETLKRILEAIEDDPLKLEIYLDILPSDRAVSDFVKRLFENALREQEVNYAGSSKVREWLKYNSDMFASELLGEARNINVPAENEANIISHQEKLIALAAVDWDQALPLIELLETNSPNSSAYTMAQYVRYHHALSSNSKSGTENYRSNLQKIVEDKKASHKSRDMAMDALVLGGDFEGRAEWYMSLLGDESLLELQEKGFTGLTTLPRHSPQGQEQWVPRMTELIRSDNPAVRTAAVRNLIKIAGKKDPDVLRLLIPWLIDRDWVKESGDNERSSLIKMFGEIEIPESVPGLISVVMRETGELRSAAARSLTLYKPPEAISALKYSLEDELDYDHREGIIAGLIACGGLNGNEQMAGLEAFATLISTDEGRIELNAYKYGYPEDETRPLSANIVVGEFLSTVEDPSGEVVYQLIKRLEVLRRSNPPVAAILLGFMQKWNHRLIDLEMYSWMDRGIADADSLLNILARREKLRLTIPGELSAVGGKNALTLGFSAVITADQGQMIGLLKQSDNDAKTALLAAARLTRTKIPVSEVAPFLNNSNKLLSLAAQRYLEADDSSEARRLILANKPDEVAILGARHAFIPDKKAGYSENTALDNLFVSVTGEYFWAGSEDQLIMLEDRFRSEIKESNGLQAVYAFIGEAASEKVIRVFKDRITLTIYSDTAHFRERRISTDEYQVLYQYLIAAQVDEIAPQIAECEFNCPTGEFIMFGRSGGRRIFYRTDSMSEKLMELDRIFDDLGRGKMDLRYRLAEKIKGVEILLADENLVAHAVWKDGGEMRVLVEDLARKSKIFENIFRQEQLEALGNPADYLQREEVQKKRRERIIFDYFSWRKFENGKLSETAVPQPVGLVYLSEFPSEPYYSDYSNPQTFQRQFGGFEFRANQQTGNDLVKIDQTGFSSVIKEGIYDSPVVLPDGKHVIAAKKDGWGQLSRIVRVNLVSNVESDINIPPSEFIQPICFIGSINRMLVIRSKIGDPKPMADIDRITAEYYLVDTNTGTVQKTKGEFRPLVDQTYRGLQPTGRSDEFWATIYDDQKNETAIGRYNSRTFVFTAQLTVPEIKLNSMDIWVDETEGKVYLVYRNQGIASGHLLRLPFQN